jgi:hypothetical protein
MIANTQPTEQSFTLRDYFAGQSLAGLCARAAVDEQEPATIAALVYAIADEMLEEHVEPKQEGK